MKMVSHELRNYRINRTSLSSFVRELSREMHAGRETERICIEHRIVRIEHLVHSELTVTVAVAGAIGGLESRGRLVNLARALVWTRLVRHDALRWHRVRERGGVLVGTSGLVAWVVFDEIGLGIVFLFCTHGINLRRT